MVRLMDAGLASFAELGWHESSIDDVVARADTSHGTFYLYFGNKQDLLVTLAHECAADMLELLGQLGPVDAGVAGREHVRAWLERYLDTYERHGGIVRAWMERQVEDPDLAALRDEVMARFGAHFTDLVGGPHSAVRAAALLAMLERFSYVLASRDLALDRDRVLDTLATITHRGFLR